MKFKFNWKMLALIAVINGWGCQPEDIDVPGNHQTDTLTGIVEFVFPVASQRVPLAAIHRLDLSLAVSTFDLYRGNLLISANVSDLVVNYRFRLDPGDYYYQAGLICTCSGDTCLWDGFPGGQMGIKWTLGRITIAKGQTVTETIHF